MNMTVAGTRHGPEYRLKLIITFIAVYSNRLYMKHARELFFCIALLFLLSSCLFRSDGYSIYMVCNGVRSVDMRARVTLEGRDIGKVDRVVAGDSNRVLLELRIKKDVKIPKNDTVVCRENILGDTFVDISSGSGNTGGGFLNEKDTVYASYVSLDKALDSTAKAKIFYGLKAVRNALDSAARRDSLHKGK